MKSIIKNLQFVPRTSILEVKRLLCRAIIIANLFLPTANSFAQSNRIWHINYPVKASASVLYNYRSSVATDTSGNVYLAGNTSSASGIASSGFQNTFGGGQDAFLVKFDAAGNRLWATYYGGTGNDEGYNVTTDAVGNVYLAGKTSSTSGIASSGFQNIFGGGSDAFLVKFDAAGNRIWATYYGGTGYDGGWSVATDVAGNVYLAGVTNSSSSIASGGFQNTINGSSDAFLVKFDASGNRIWATYYGGTGSGAGGNDFGRSVATDTAGNIYLAGETSSSSGIASGGFQNSLGAGGWNAFLVKFNSSGTRLWATYYGGAGWWTYGTSVATDISGNVYMAGRTDKGIAGDTDAFLIKISASGGLLWNIYYGGVMGDYGYSVATDVLGNVYLAGFTGSSSGIASGGFQNVLMIGSANLFLAKFDANGSRSCATYYAYAGKEYTSQADLALDASGNVYLSGGIADAISIGGQNAQGPWDAFLVKFTSCFAPLNVAAYSSNISCNSQCTGTTTANVSGGTPPYTYQWNTVPLQNTASAKGLCAGTYMVTITDVLGATSSATATVTEPLTAVTTSITSLVMSCSAQCTGSATANGSGGIPAYTYSWNNGQTTSTITGLCAGDYTVTITDANGCTQAKMVSISSLESPSATASSTNVSCSGSSDGSATVNATGGTSPYTYWWNTVPVQNTANANELSSGTYTAIITDANGCTGLQIVKIEPATGAGELYFPNAFSPNQDGENDMLQIYYGNMQCIKTCRIVIYNQWGEKVFEAADQTFKWDGKYGSNLPIGQAGSLTTGTGKILNTQALVYYLRVEFTDQTLLERKGNLSLVR